MERRAPESTQQDRPETPIRNLFNQVLLGSYSDAIEAPSR